MAFDPDAYLAAKDAQAFDPDAYLAATQQTPQLGNMADQVPGVLPQAQAAPEPTSTLAEDIAAFPVTRLATGAAAPVMSALEHLPGGAGQFIRENNQTLKDMVARGRETQSTPMRQAGDIYDVAGTVLNPAALKIAKAVPFLHGAKTLIGKAGQYAGNIGTGAGMAGLFSLMQPGGNVENPVEAKVDKALDAAPYGALFAAGVPLMTGAAKLGESVVRGGRRLVDAHLEGGIERASARVANKAAGDGRDAVIRELTKTRAATPGIPLPPGVQGPVAPAPLTAGQAAANANNTGFSGLEKAVAPYASQSFRDVDAAAKAARLAEIRTVSKDAPTLEAAVSARGAQAAKDYTAAYAKQIKADPDLVGLFKNPFIKDAAPDAARLAQAAEVTNKARPGLTEYLHYVKLSLDKQLSKTGETALSNTEKAAVAKAKEQLIGWIKAKNPAYDAARTNFAAASKPINQMQVGQELEKRLMNPSGKETAGAFLGSLDDAARTIKRGTGQRFDKLSDVLEPQQVQAARNVATDLERNLLYEDLAKRGTTEATQMVNQAIPTTPPTGIFAPAISAARSWVNTAKGDATEQMVKLLAERMAKDPQGVARMMQNVPPEQKPIIAELVRRTMAARPAMAGATGLSQE